MVRVKPKVRVPSLFWWSGKGDEETRNSLRAMQNQRVVTQKPRECAKKREGGKQGQIMQISSKMDLKNVHWVCQVEEGPLAMLTRQFEWR